VDLLFHNIKKYIAFILHTKMITLLIYLYYIKDVFKNR
jgi:hypothetical protein